MSNPTGRTGKRTAVRTATRTIVYYRTADGKPSRTLEITPKGHRYFSTATKREIEQAGGAPAKAGFVSKNPRGKKYR